jgi:hypothetical protein
MPSGARTSGAAALQDDHELDLPHMRVSAPPASRRSAPWRAQRRPASPTPLRWRSGGSGAAQASAPSRRSPANSIASTGQTETQQSHRVQAWVSTSGRNGPPERGRKRMAPASRTSLHAMQEIPARGRYPSNTRIMPGPSLSDRPAGLNCRPTRNALRVIGRASAMDYPDGGSRWSEDDLPVPDEQPVPADHDDRPDAESKDEKRQHFCPAHSSRHMACLDPSSLVLGHDFLMCLGRYRDD